MLNGVSWSELVDEIGDSFSHPPALTRTLRDTLAYAHTVCVHVCVLAVRAVTRLWFHPAQPFAFRPLCSPFQFQSSPRWIQTILETAEYIELFCMATEEEKSAHQKKSSLGLPDRLRQGLVNLHLGKVLSLQCVAATWAFNVTTLLD